MDFKSDYYYGNEAEQYVFYRIPKVLFTEPHFKKLSNDARVLYGLMLDRMGLSIKNGWCDDNGRIYIYFTLEDIQEYMNCGHTKGVKIIAELEKINLIERVKQGQGKPAKIYIKKFFTNDNNTYPQKSTDYPQCYPQNASKNQDFRKQEMQTSANEKSRLHEKGSADFTKTDANNKYNNNDFNDIDLNKSMSKSCHVKRADCDNDYNYNYDSDNDYDFSDSESNPFFQADEKHKQLENYIKNQIGYDFLISNNSADKSEVDSLLLLIIETLMSNSPYIRIDGENKPQSVVKSVFMKVDYGSIMYTINKFKQQKHEIKYKKSYLLSCLYNSHIEGIYNGINYLNSRGYELP